MYVYISGGSLCSVTRRGTLSAKTKVMLWNSAQCYVAAGRGVWGEWIHVYVWLSFLAVHLKPSQHC